MQVGERPTATVEQVFDLADGMRPRWRLMVLLGAFASLRPQELAELRRHSVDIDTIMDVARPRGGLPRRLR